MNKDIRSLLADPPLEREDEFMFLNYANPFASTLLVLCVSLEYSKLGKKVK